MTVDYFKRGPAVSGSALRLKAMLFAAISVKIAIGTLNVPIGTFKVPMAIFTEIAAKSIAFSRRALPETAGPRLK